MTIYNTAVTILDNTFLKDWKKLFISYIYLENKLENKVEKSYWIE